MTNIMLTTNTTTKIIHLIVSVIRIKMALHDGLKNRDDFHIPISRFPLLDVIPLMMRKNIAPI